ncbi:MAG: hypothetical protein IPM29_27155 [Planctomycetes bacterium]|nr:hypothetical protein [Planctomycetota bacterium]
MHGEQRGWVRADAQGRYRFESIRPEEHPGREDPQHVHMHVIEPGRRTYYIENTVFTDDPLLTAERRERESAGRGGHGMATPRREDEGVWVVRRDIVLGAGTPGYPALEE